MLGIFLGGFGVHRFYLGNNSVGIAQLVLTCFTGMGAVWGFVEGLMILCNARSFRTDAHGIPLK
ncbi:TM2 domain-containing protein [Arthrobacter sp. zg-Y238]|nr:TM2 domain-containing protein [Arthrobacter sp. zg-Y238]